MPTPAANKALEDYNSSLGDLTSGTEGATAAMAGLGAVVGVTSGNFKKILGIVTGGIATFKSYSKTVFNLRREFGAHEKEFIRFRQGLMKSHKLVTLNSQQLAKMYTQLKRNSAIMMKTSGSMAELTKWAEKLERALPGAGDEIAAMLSEMADRMPGITTLIEQNANSVSAMSVIYEQLGADGLRAFQLIRDSGSRVATEAELIEVSFRKLDASSSKFFETIAKAPTKILADMSDVLSGLLDKSASWLAQNKEVAAGVGIAAIGGAALGAKKLAGAMGKGGMVDKLRGGAGGAAVAVAVGATPVYIVDISPMATGKMGAADAGVAGAGGKKALSKLAKAGLLAGGAVVAGAAIASAYEKKRKTGEGPDVGGVVTGAAGGALAGAAFGPWGALIGGTLGGISTLLTGWFTTSEHLDRERNRLQQQAIEKQEKAARVTKIQRIREARGEIVGQVRGARLAEMEEAREQIRAALHTIKSVADTFVWSEYREGIEYPQMGTREQAEAAKIADPELEIYQRQLSDDDAVKVQEKLQLGQKQFLRGLNAELAIKQHSADIAALNAQLTEQSWKNTEELRAAYMRVAEEQTKLQVETENALVEMLKINEVVGTEAELHKMAKIMLDGTIAAARERGELTAEEARKLGDIVEIEKVRELRTKNININLTKRAALQQAALGPIREGVAILQAQESIMQSHVGILEDLYVSPLKIARVYKNMLPIILQRANAEKEMLVTMRQQNIEAVAANKKRLWSAIQIAEQEVKIVSTTREYTAAIKQVRRSWEEVFTQRVMGLPVGSFLLPTTTGLMEKGPTFMPFTPSQQTATGALRGFGTYGAIQQLAKGGARGPEGIIDAIGDLLDVMKKVEANTADAADAGPPQLDIMR